MMLPALCGLAILSGEWVWALERGSHQVTKSIPFFPPSARATIVSLQKAIQSSGDGPMVEFGF
jgi:hypothetical protein